jgi:hypothetical protein
MPMTCQGKAEVASSRRSVAFGTLIAFTLL